MSTSSSRSVPEIFSLIGYYSTSLFVAPGPAAPEPEPEVSYALGI